MEKANEDHRGKAKDVAELGIILRTLKKQVGQTDKINLTVSTAARKAERDKAILDKQYKIDAKRTKDAGPCCF